VSWRSIVISKPCKLSRERFQLAIQQERTAFVPFEDIAVILLNHREIVLTHAVLSACGEHGISLFSTGDSHHPNGVFLPFLTHTRTTRWMRLQLKLARPVAKRTWAEIVKRKIANQAACLSLAGCDGVQRLESYSRRVRSGDTDNLEGQAASYYFTQLFGKDFRRTQDRFINSALNYGYAVLRGTIARGLVAHGFMPAIGLFHSSEQNAFNLADDVIEPFRPLVDLCISRLLLPRTESELLPSDKISMVGLLNADMDMPRGRMSTLSCIEQSIESLARIYDGGNEQYLELPILIGVDQHTLEY